MMTLSVSIRGSLAKVMYDLLDLVTSRVSEDTTFVSWRLIFFVKFFTLQYHMCCYVTCIIMFKLLFKCFVSPL